MMFGLGIEREWGGVDARTITPVVVTREWPAYFDNILDFDIENRPLSYLGMDFTTADITAIASCNLRYTADDKFVVDASSKWCGMQDKSTTSLPRLLREFVRRFNEATCVTGHYITRHDLGHINGQLFEFGMPLLKRQYVWDTKTQLKRFTAISKSQENLGEMLGIDTGKYHMSTPKWRDANRLTTTGLATTRARVTADVDMHMEMLEALHRAGVLNPPVLWEP